MRLVDANVLLYAVNADAEHHRASQRWLDSALAGADTVGLTWIVLLAFLRLATRSSIFPHPLTLEEATSQVQDWITAPGTAMIEPLPDHARVLAAMLRQADAGGNLVNDAHLAALALSHRADLVSYDSDFERFREVRRFRPDDLLA